MSDAKFAEEFYKLYTQGTVVAETWRPFFDDVDALIRELDASAAPQK